MSSSANAAFTLNGTRFIYNESDSNISFIVTNNDNSLYGGQVWIENESVKNKNEVFLISRPSFFKVRSNRSQVIRVIKINDNLPSDRESIFWLNVQEIPPVSEVGRTSSLVLAMNTKVKLIYRPEGLDFERDGAESNLQFLQQNGKVYLRNKTPYFFAITDIKIDNESVRVLNGNKLGLVYPKSKVLLENLSYRDIDGKKIVITAIDDFGGDRKYEIN